MHPPLFLLPSPGTYTEHRGALMERECASVCPCVTACHRPRARGATTRCSVGRGHKAHRIGTGTGEGGWVPLSSPSSPSPPEGAEPLRGGGGCRRKEEGGGPLPSQGWLHWVLPNPGGGLLWGHPPGPSLHPQVCSALWDVGFSACSLQPGVLYPTSSTDLAVVWGGWLRSGRA